MTPRFNTVRDELTFNADDNEHTSESPKKHFRKVKTLKHYEIIYILPSYDGRKYEKLLFPRLSEDNPETLMLFDFQIIKKTFLVKP